MDEVDRLLKDKRFADFKNLVDENSWESALKAKLRENAVNTVPGTAAKMVIDGVRPMLFAGPEENDYFRPRRGEAIYADGRLVRLKLTNSPFPFPGSPPLSMEIPHFPGHLCLPRKGAEKQSLFSFKMWLVVEVYEDGRLVGLRDLGDVRVRREYVSELRFEPQGVYYGGSLPTKAAKIMWMRSSPPSE